ncbi:hypothetical protein KBD81_05140 [Candidatus Woesebacteria bacterium]|nr:hypothetical protein [Candidatus Woesebacteria bacterium]
MSKHFYTHLIEIDSIHTRLERLPMHSTEREELIMLVHESLHHVVLDVVLTKLTSTEGKQFLSHVTHGCHDEIWLLLSSKIEDPETEIKNAITAFISELHADIEELDKETLE